MIRAKRLAGLERGEFEIDFLKCGRVFKRWDPEHPEQWSLLTTRGVNVYDVDAQHDNIVRASRAPVVLDALNAIISGDRAPDRRLAPVDDGALLRRIDEIKDDLNDGLIDSALQKALCLAPDVGSGWSAIAGKPWSKLGPSLQRRRGETAPARTGVIELLVGAVRRARGRDGLRMLARCIRGSSLDRAVTWHILGAAAIEEDDHPLKRRFLRAALRAGPEGLSAAMSLISDYAPKNKRAACRALAERLAREKPGDPDAILAQAVALSLDGRTDQAKRLCLDHLGKGACSHDEAIFIVEKIAVSFSAPDRKAITEACLREFDESPYLRRKLAESTERREDSSRRSD